MTDHDLIVLGAGPGGYAAALYGASAGLNVALVEENKVGGTCLHRGCIPAKAMLQAAEVFRTVGDAGDFGTIDRSLATPENRLMGPFASIEIQNGVALADGHGSIRGRYGLIGRPKVWAWAVTGDRPQSIIYLDGENFGPPSN